MILRSDVLDGLSVISVDVHSNHTSFELGVRALENLVVLMLFVIEGVEAFKNKVKQRPQVLWSRCSDKNVAETIDNSASNRNSKCS